MFLDKFKQPYLFGHRGFSQNYPENNIESFKACMENDVKGVELDVQVCKSGEVVINHDFDLKRICNIDKKIKELTLTELKQLDFGSFKDPKFSNCRITTLKELFEECKDNIYYDIELKEESLKDTGLCKKVLSLIKEYHLEDNCMISSFNPFSVRRFNIISFYKFDTAIIFAPHDGPRILWYGFGRFIAKCNILKPSYKLIDEKFMKKFKKYKICTWTVNEKHDCQRLLDLGVSGICGNDPVSFKQIIKSHKA